MLELKVELLAGEQQATEKQVPAMARFLPVPKGDSAAESRGADTEPLGAALAKEPWPERRPRNTSIHAEKYFCVCLWFFRESILLLGIVSPFCPGGEKANGGRLAGVQ